VKRSNQIYFLDHYYHAMIDKGRIADREFDVDLIISTRLELDERAPTCKSINP
jgi:hypothetical protein